MSESEAPAARSRISDAPLLQRAGPALRGGPLEQRLRLLCETLAELLADPDQIVQIEVACSGACPPALHGAVLRAALELVGNAVRHGFYQRLVGRLRVELASGAHGTRLIVADDGWGLGCRPGKGQGLPLLRAAVAPLGGTLALRGGDGVTAEVFLPCAVDEPRIGGRRVVH